MQAEWRRSKKKNQLPALVAFESKRLENHLFIQVRTFQILKANPAFLAPLAQECIQDVTSPPSVFRSSQPDCFPVGSDRVGADSRRSQREPVHKVKQAVPPVHSGPGDSLSRLITGRSSPLGREHRRSCCSF